MALEAQALTAIAFLLLFCIFLMWMIGRERKKYEVDEFDGGFIHDYQPRAMIKIKSTFIEEDRNEYNS